MLEPDALRREEDADTRRPAWVPDGVALDKPSAARMYDYFLGGYHNFAIDRQAAHAVTAVYPDMPLVMRANRGFLHRAVRYLVNQGVERFLDVGSGIPTVGNVHEVAQQINPNVYVVYVDVDPVAVAHSEAILRGNTQAEIIQADALHPTAILDDARVRPLLDGSQPVAILLVALLHFITVDAQADSIARLFREALPPGGYLVLSHASQDGMRPEIAEQLHRLYAGTSNPVKARTRAEVSPFLKGLDLVEPGLVYPPLWRPDGPDDTLLDEPARSAELAGVGRKPSPQ